MLKGLFGDSQKVDANILDDGFNVEVDIREEFLKLLVVINES